MDAPLTGWLGIKSLLDGVFQRGGMRWVWASHIGHTARGAPCCYGTTPLSAPQVVSMSDKPWWDWNAEKEVRRRCFIKWPARAAAGRVTWLWRLLLLSVLVTLLPPLWLALTCTLLKPSHPARITHLACLAIHAGVGLVPRPARQPEDRRRHRRALGAQEGGCRGTLLLESFCWRRWVD